MEDMNNFIDAMVQKDYAQANGIFNELMGQKIDTALDAEKINVAGQIFNDVEPEDDDVSDEEIEAIADEAIEDEEEWEDDADYAEDDDNIEDVEEEGEHLEAEDEFEDEEV